MRGGPVVVAALWTALGGGLTAQCDTIAGAVTAGRTFERTFADGLRFRLRPAAHAPPNPPGWTIEVRDTAGGADDFVWVATPPYRGPNPRDLTTSYGRTGEEVVAREVRTFRFVTGPAEYRALAEAVDFLLWRPPGVTKARYDAAYDSVRGVWRERLEQAGRGELRITDAVMADSPPGRPPDRIERLAFVVTLCTARAEGGGAEGTATRRTVPSPASSTPSESRRPGSRVQARGGAPT